MAANENHKLTVGTEVRATAPIRALAVNFPGWGAPNYADFFEDHSTGQVGEVVGVESHGQNPWTRYTVRWIDGSRTSGVTPDRIEVV